MPPKDNILNTNEIHNKLENYQNYGESEQKPIEEHIIKLPKIGTVAERMKGVDLQAPISESYTEQALEEGYGTSRYDMEFVPGKDLEHSRALEQSGFAKIASGVTKGGITAATTAVNTTLGTVYGLGSALFELAADANGNGRSFMDTIDAGVNNWLSNQMVKIQNWSEEVFPNYRTEQERSEQYQKEWYKHMGTANFIGDSLLKNFGFTVGAMVGGMAWTKVIGAGLSKAVANNIMKGAVAAAEGDAEATALLKEAAAAVRAGTATEAQAALARAGEAVQRGTAAAADYARIQENIKRAGRGINRMKAQLQLYGAAIGAMGEGTVEGIMARNEFLDNYKAKLSRQFAEEYDNLEREILESGNEHWVENKVYQDPEWGLVSVPTLTELGKKHLKVLQRDLTEHYQEVNRYADEQGNRLASTTFLLNLPVLTTSNLVQFGRMFSGGWQTARKNSVKGGLKTAAKQLAADYAPKGGSIAAKSVLGSLKVAGSEAFEEMAQGTISSGAQTVAGKRLSEFNDTGFDDESTRSVREWFSGMYEGGKEYLSDIKNWQEGALGAITGLLGIPGRRWSGGIVGAVQDAKEEINASKDAAAALNARVNSKDFQDRWRGYIRHLKYDNDMDRAVTNDDEYEWHTADDNQLASDVVAFADAGRLDDLKEIASYFGNISTAEAQSLRDVIQKENGDERDWTKNLSDDEIVNKVKKQADKIQTAVNDYSEMYDALKARAPMDASDDFIKEMLFTAMHIKNMDRRYLEVLGETLNEVEPVIMALAAVSNTDQEQRQEEVLDRAKKLRSGIEAMFAGSLLPVRQPKALQDAMSVLDDLTAIGDPEINKKVRDLKRMSEDRQNYFLKLQTMRDNKRMENGNTAQENFEEEKVSQDKVDDAADKAYAQEVTKDLNTLEDVKQQYFQKNAKERAEFADILQSAEDHNPAVKKFMQIKRRHDGFKAYIQEHGTPVENTAVNSNMINGLVNDLLRYAKTEEELINLPDNVFTPSDQFILAHTKPLFGAPDVRVYAAAKKAIKDAMQQYLQNEGDTSTRNNLKPENKPQEKPAEAKVTPEGYDASQPASVDSAPKPVEKKEEVKPETKQESEPHPVPQEEQEKPEAAVEIGKKPTEEELAKDASEPITEDAQEDSQESYLQENGKGKQKKTHYGTSIPEIDSWEAAKARDVMRSGNFSALKDIDLSDFVQKHPEYSELWNALNDRQAFDNVAQLVEVGDEVEFIVDPSFPKYKDQYQILMTTMKNGERKVLSILSGQTSEYYGLHDLRMAIDKEYQEFRDKNPNDVFVFSQKSPVWAKRAGLIDYDYTTDYSGEKRIDDIPKYDKDAPIVFINRKYKTVVVRGDEQAANSVSSDFASEEDNRRKGRRGNLYYLAKNPHGEYEYVPIRLNVEHFRQDNREADNATFGKIRKYLGNITNLVKDTTSENAEEQNAKLRKEVAELIKVLDLHDVYFEIGDYTNIGPALKIVTNYKSAEQKGKDALEGIEDNDEEEQHFRTAAQITDSWLESFIAKLEKPVQVRTSQTASGVETIDNLNDLLSDGMITSNAKMLRPKGVDFYINPWHNGKFSPVTEKQSEVAAIISDKKGTRITTNGLSDDAGFSERELVGAVKPISQPARNISVIYSSEQEVPKVDVSDYITIPFSDLPSGYLTHLVSKGYSEEEWNDMSDLEKQRILQCIFIG